MVGGAEPAPWRRAGPVEDGAELGVGGHPQLVLVLGQLAQALGLQLVTVLDQLSQQLEPDSHERVETLPPPLVGQGGGSVDGNDGGGALALDRHPGREGHDAPNRATPHGQTFGHREPDPGMAGEEAVTRRQRDLVPDRHRLHLGAGPRIERIILHPDHRAGHPADEPLQRQGHDRLPAGQTVQSGPGNGASLGAGHDADQAQPER
jgi:hypothetical protein